MSTSSYAITSIETSLRVSSVEGALSLSGGRGILSPRTNTIIMPQSSPQAVVMKRDRSNENLEGGETSQPTTSNSFFGGRRFAQQEQEQSQELPHEKRGRKDDTNDGGAAATGVSHQKFSPAQVQRALNVPMEDTNAAMSAGILASGLAWVQRNRDRRRRQYLQHQAEQQLRKIAEAERPGLVSSSADKTTTTQGLKVNSTFQQLVGGTTAGSFSLDDTTSTPRTSRNEDNLSGFGHASLSKSGEGSSAQIDIFDLEEDEYLTPKVRVEPSKDDSQAPYILTPEQMNQIAVHVLPKTIAFCKWRRLYGLGRDGDSFAACLRIVHNVQRTLMVVRTTRGQVFGGYADSPWHSSELGNNKFYGGSQACLFRVDMNHPLATEAAAAKDTKTPSVVVGESNNNNSNSSTMIHVYRWTGKNRYIQLCDTSSKMFAFGGGGDEGAFGLCVQEDFQMGSTGPCDTFDNAPLCDQENFEIVDLEFWEFLTGEF